MKMTYQLLKTTKLESSIVINMICGKLVKEDYRILSVDGMIIKFDKSVMKFTSMIGATSKIDEGIFEISKSEEELEVRFTYSQLYTTDIVILILLLLLAIIFSYYFLLFFLVVIVAFFIRIPLVKESGEEFLDELFKS